MSQRTEDFGWAGDTARVVTALASAVEDWPQKNDLEARLSAKQLELELLAKLLRLDYFFSLVVVIYLIIATFPLVSRRESKVYILY